MYVLLHVCTASLVYCFTCVLLHVCTCVRVSMCVLVYMCVHVCTYVCKYVYLCISTLSLYRHPVPEEWLLHSSTRLHNSVYM
jgi:hypothetical protein